MKVNLAKCKKINILHYLTRFIVLKESANIEPKDMHIPLTGNIINKAIYHREVAVDMLKSFKGCVVVASTNVRRNSITISSVIQRRLQQQTRQLQIADFAHGTQPTMCTG